MKQSRLEKETIITFNEQEKTAVIYTHNAALCRKLDKLADERPQEAKRHNMPRAQELGLAASV